MATVIRESDLNKPQALNISPDNSKKKSMLFGKITTKDEALKIIKDCSYGYYFIACLTILVGLFLMPNIIFDGILYGILGIFLYAFKSRVAAILLLLLSALAATITITNMLGITAEGGNNIILAIIMLYVGFRSVQATFKLRKLVKSEQQTISQ